MNAVTAEIEKCVCTNLAAFATTVWLCQGQVPLV